MKQILFKISLLILLGFACTNQKVKESLNNEKLEIKCLEIHEIEKIIKNEYLQKELEKIIHETRQIFDDEEILFFPIVFYEEDQENVLMTAYSIRPSSNFENFIGFYRYYDICLLIYNELSEDIPSLFINIEKLNKHKEDLDELNSCYGDPFDPTCYVYRIEEPSSLVFKRIRR